MLGLVYLEKTQGAAQLTVTLAVTATVLVSIFAHGLSAKASIGVYGRDVESLGDDAPEKGA